MTTGLSWRAAGKRVRDLDPDAVRGREIALRVPARGWGGRAGLVDDPDILEQAGVGAVARAAKPQADGAAAQGRLGLVLAFADERSVDLEPEPVVPAAELDLVPSFRGGDVFGFGDQHVPRMPFNEGIRLVEAGMEGAHIVGDGACRENPHGPVGLGGKGGRSAGVLVRYREHDDIDALGLERLGRKPQDDVLLEPVRRDERDPLGILPLEKAQGFFGGVDLGGPDADQGPAGELLGRIDLLGLRRQGRTRYRGDDQQRDQPGHGL